MKLEVGMYVRTKNGYICKILRETYSKYLSRNKELCYEVDKPINTNMELYVGDILKASHNIIDLIERFDLVNGHLVICKMYEDEKDIPTIIKCVGDYYFKEEDIKSIVTKEMFANAEYKVETN